MSQKLERIGSLLAVLLSLSVSHANNGPGPASVPVRVEELKEENAERPKFLGDIGGRRTRLQESGVTLIGTYLGDIGANVRGDMSGGQALGFLYTGIDVNLEPLIGWNGGRFLTSAYTSHGGAFSKQIGDAQFSSNIEAGESAVRLYEALIEQKLFNGSLSVQLGLHDMNSEFNVTPSSLFFINSSFAVDSGLALSGEAGPPTYPLTSVGLRVKVEPVENFYAMAAMFDGKPGHITSSVRDQFQVNSSEEGYLSLNEAGYADSDLNAVGIRKLAAGYWYYTKNRDHTDGNDAPKQARSDGGYLMADLGLTKKVGFTARWGATNGKVNQVIQNTAIALSGRGFFGDMDHDRWGIGFIQARFATPWISSKQSEGNDMRPTETVFEATGSWRFYPGFYLQPDLQLILNPGGMNVSQNPLVAYLRIEVNI